MKQETILDKKLSARQARKVAKALKAVGFQTLTIAECRKHTIQTLGVYVCPKHLSTRLTAMVIACKAAGIPTQLEIEK